MAVLGGDDVLFIRIHAALAQRLESTSEQALHGVRDACTVLACHIDSWTDKICIYAHNAGIGDAGADNTRLDGCPLGVCTQSTSEIGPLNLFEREALEHALDVRVGQHCRPNWVSE